MIPYTFLPCVRSDILKFVESNHYSHNLNGVKTKYCFKIMLNDQLVGAMVFGRLGMANVWKRYATNESDVLELRRLVCIDDTPRNTESWFIGNALRWLRKHTDVKVIISYADETYNHTGTIYRASNFKYLGMTKAGRMIKYDGRLYHDKTIRTKYKGQLKPYAQRLVYALEHKCAEYVNTKGKHIYLYTIRR